MFLINSRTYTELSESYHQHLTIIGHSAHGALVKYRYLLKFLQHLETEGIQSLNEVQPHHLTAYYQKIKTETNRRTGNPKNLKTLCNMMHSIELFYMMLQETGQVKTNPFSTLKFTYPKQYHERTVLTQEEIQQLYNTCRSFTERALLSLAYGCGLRVSEIVSLNVEDIMLREAILIVKRGKGNKRRVIPLGNKVKEDLYNYFYHERPSSLPFGEGWGGASFIFNSQGGRMKKHTYNKLLKILVKRTENETIKQKKISMYTLRHSIATHLLEQGMGIEQVRAFLGHAEIETTEIYTHISQTQLNKLI
jgi:integrase/recombinase XerD